MGLHLKIHNSFINLVWIAFVRNVVAMRVVMLVGLILVCGMAFGEIVTTFDNISYPAVASKEITVKDCYQTVNVPLNQAAIQKIQYCKLNNIPFWLGIKDNSNITSTWFSNKYYHFSPIPLYINGRLIDLGLNEQFHLRKDTTDSPDDYTPGYLSAPTVGSREIWGGRDYPLQTLYGTENYRWFHSYDVNFRGRIKTAYVRVTVTEVYDHLPPDDSTFHFVVIPDDIESYYQVETGPSPIQLHWYGYWTYIPMKEYLYELLNCAGSLRGKFYAIYASWDRSRAKAGDPVDLATGEETHSPQPDIVVPNPYGPGISFSRTYSSALAKTDYGSPGLPKGWTNNFDYRIEVPAEDWGSLILCHSNGYSQEITPELNSNVNPTNPTNFKLEDGTPYVITGVPSTTPGLWDSITMTSEDHMSMVFTKPAGFESYQLERITNRYGRSIRFTGRTAINNYAPLQIEDVTTGKILLKFKYDTNGLLTELIEFANGKPYRKVGYKYGTSLSKVTKIKPAAAAITANAWSSPRWEYTYTPYDGKQLLTTVSQPSPTGSGISTLTFTIDSEGRVVSQKDSKGTKISFAYADNSTEVITTNSANAQIINRYTQKLDIYGRDAGVIGVDNTQASINYGNDIFSDRPTSATDRNGQSVSLTYNDDGKVTEVAGPYGTATNIYDGAGQLSKLTTVKKNGVTQASYTYTSKYDLIKTVSELRPGATTESLVTTTYIYDFEKDPNGPNYGRVVEVDEPASAATGTRKITRSYCYDHDPNYDVDGLKPGPYKPAVQTTLPLTITDENNRTTHYRYDARGNVTKIVDPDGLRTEMTYNIADQVVLTIGPLDPNTQKQQIVVSEYYYVGGFLHYSYIFSNNSEYQKFKNGIQGAKYYTIEYKYDSEGKLISSLLDNKVQIEKVYDYIGRLIKLKDCRGVSPRTTTFTFDSVGHLTDVDGPANQTVHNTAWDSNGCVITSTDGRGIRSTYNYNLQGKKELLSIDYYDTVNDVSCPSVSYTYYPDGQVHTVTDNTGTRTYNYDLAGNSTSVETNYTGNVSATIYYNYFQDGSLASNQIADGTKTFDYNYTYDKDGRLITLKNPDNKKVRWTFNPDRSLKSQELDNKVVTQYKYDSFDRLTEQKSIDNSNVGSLLVKYNGFKYDDVNFGGLTGYDTNILGKPALTGNRSFSYDGMQRLQSENWSPQTGGTPTSGIYSFNDKGNILTSPHEITGYTGTNYRRHYNNDYQWDGYSLTADPTNALIPDSQALFQYDSNGNPTKYKDASSKLEYDAQDHLTSYKIGINTVNQQTLMTAGYRSDGLRAWKQNAAGRTYYIYSGTTLLCELNAAGEISCYNTWGPTGLLGRTVTASNKHTWYVFDPQGDVAIRLNGAGKRLSDDRYDAFGNLIAGGDNTDPYGYKGQEGYYTDHETGLILCTYRYYDPLAGRWLTADPIGFDGGLNLYAYCGGDPVNAVDPLGLWRTENTFGVLKALGGTFEIAGGFTLIAGTSGVGAVPGYLVIAHGVDTLQAGLRQSYDGGDVDTLTSMGLQSAGLSQHQANLVDAGIGIASTGSVTVIGAIKLLNASRAAEGTGLSVWQLLNEIEFGNQALSNELWVKLGKKLAEKGIDVLKATPFQKAEALREMINEGSKIKYTLQTLGASLRLWNTGLTAGGDLTIGPGGAAYYIYRGCDNGIWCEN